MLIEFAFSLFDAVLCVYFITEFNSAPLNPRANPFASVALGAIFGFSIINDLFLYGFSVLGTSIFLLLYVTYGVLVSDKKYVKGILSGCVFEVAFVLLSSLLYFVMSYFIKDYDILMQGESGVFRYAYVIAHKIALFVVLKLILMVFKSQGTLSIKQGILAFLFSFTTILGLGAVMYICAELDVQGIQPQAIIIASVLATGNVILYVLIYQIQKEEQARRELGIIKEKIAFEELRKRDILGLWREMRAREHDIKHHLAVIKGYADQDNLQGASEYIEGLMPEVSFSKRLVRSENDILDYLISSRLGGLTDTEIVISGSVGSLKDISDIDLACLMGNILDNALEALGKVKGKQKRLELLFSRQNMNRIIICKNTVQTSVLSDNKQLKTTKDEAMLHGFGMKIISRTVEKYGGIVDCFEEFGMFGIQVVLPIA